MAQFDKVFPTGKPAQKLLHDLIESVVSHPNITIYILAELADIKGYVGDFQAQIRQQSRGVSEDIPEAAMAACTIEVPNEHDYGLTTRRAIYFVYEGCYTPTPAVDWDPMPCARKSLSCAVIHS